MTRSVFEMMKAPPSDRSLRPDDVRRVVRDQFPELHVDGLRHLGSGWEHDVYLVDETFIFRFPRYAAVADGLEYDRAVHDLVHRHVDGVLQVPAVTLFGHASADFPHRFVGHAMVPGVGADDAKARGVSRRPLGTDLGRALTRVHAIPQSEAAAVGIQRMGPDCGRAFSMLMRQIPHVPQLHDLAPEASRWLDGSPEVPSEAEAPARFIHNGLHEEHVLVDPVTGRLSGIIDWSSAAVGDPAIDLAFVLLLAGPLLLHHALASYDLEVDPWFEDRIVFRARVRSIGWLAYAVHRGGDTRRILEQVAFAFAELRSSATRASTPGRRATEDRDPASWTGKDERMSISPAPVRRRGVTPNHKETPMKITVETLVRADLSQVWDAWNNPADIKQWNTAQDDWHTTRSTVDLREGGKFVSRMEAKDGSEGFDFEGTYTRIVPHETIEYRMSDGREVKVEFAEHAKGVLVKETFDTETENPPEVQREGWQAILDNFGRHVEGEDVRQ